MGWYIQITWDYVIQMLPCALIGALGFFCIYPWRKKRLSARGLKSGLPREAALFFLVLFSAGLAALTLFPANYWAHTAFQPIALSVGEFYAKITIVGELTEIIVLGSPWGLFMLLGNLVMFAPFGFFPALVGDKPRWWKALLTGFCASAFIEFVQLFIGRSSDINDMILNTVGALCGFWAYLLLKRFAPQFITKFKLQRTEVPNGREAGNKAAP